MKPFWHSKTFWVNLLAVGAMVGQTVSGQSVFAEPETQAVGLGVVNLILRLVTKDAVTLGRSS